MPGPVALIAVICPPLAGSPSLSTYVGEAANMTSPDFFGALTSQAIALRAAHMYTLDVRMMGAAGPVAGLQEGKLSVRYQVTHDGSDLGQTQYGLRLQGIMRSRPRMGVNMSRGGPI